MKLAGGETSLNNKRIKLSFYFSREKKEKFMIHRKKNREFLILLERERK